MPRVIRVGEAISDMVWAVRGIVAGSGGATSEMRLVRYFCILDNETLLLQTRGSIYLIVKLIGFLKKLKERPFLIE